MTTNRTYRDNGAIGALLDEYERAIDDLVKTISSVSDSNLARIVDPITQDKDCVSIQTILSHVVAAGYTYAIEVRKSQGEDIPYKMKELLNSASEYTDALRTMFAYNVSLFDDYPDIKMEEYHTENKMLVRWGQRYDVDQIFEHAIVHILRHRRQIERFLIQLEQRQL